MAVGRHGCHVDAWASSSLFMRARWSARRVTECLTVHRANGHWQAVSIEPIDESAHSDSHIGRQAPLISSTTVNLADVDQGERRASNPMAYRDPDTSQDRHCDPQRWTGKRRLGWAIVSSSMAATDKRLPRTVAGLPGVGCTCWIMLSAYFTRAEPRIKGLTTTS